MNPLALLAAFLLGAMPWALWVGKLARGVDVRDHGSGNLGATNVYRTLGPGLGWTVFLLDGLKGAAAVVVCRALATDTFPGGDNGAGLAGALAAVFGHVFTPFAGWKGGKGAATAAGAMIAVAPRASALCLACFLVAALLTKRISVGSISAALTLPIFLWMVPWSRKGPGTAIVGTLVCAVILLRHLPNIRRLLAGTEPTFSLRRKDGAA
jgi:glycerol-3-phosphate acyltransferase PlsY